MSYDHKDILGESLEEILLEKMKIINRNCLAIAGYNIPNKFILENYCYEINSKLFMIEN